MNNAITEDSFGTMLPGNWREIADYLNAILEEIGYDMAEEVWEAYCNGVLQDAPEAI